MYRATGRIRVPSKKAKALVLCFKTKGTLTTAHHTQGHATLPWPQHHSLWATE